MSDYTQATDFSDKDALTTGDPEKAISGADVDGEFSLIATAIASKIDEPSSPASGEFLRWTGSAWDAEDPGSDGSAGQAYVTDGTNASWSGIVTSGSQVSLSSGSPTSVEFTGIPSWVSTVELCIVGASLSGSDSMQFRLGTSGGIDTSGYSGNADNGDGSSNFAPTDHHYVSTLSAGLSATGTITCRNMGSNLWLIESAIMRDSSVDYIISTTYLTLADTLTQVQLLSSGSNTFDAGTAVLRYW